jgi:hypothetical protein
MHDIDGGLTWVAVCSHGDSPETVRAALTALHDPMLDSLRDQLGDDPDVSAATLAAALEFMQRWIAQRVDEALPQALKDMACSAVIDRQSVH